jgi:hypothetical protein
MLALSLLVTGVGADDAQHAATAHDLALVANLLDARSYLHGVLSELLDDLASTWITGGDFDSYAAASDEPDDSVAELRCHGGNHFATVVETHSEKRAWEHLFHRADSRILRSLIS